MDFQSQKTYHRDECAIFLKTAEQFGGLSNMAGGYALSINNIYIPSTEALYQACRFPHNAELQKIIIGQRSPMTAKMKSKPYRKDSRPDWNEVRVDIMEWCLRVKLAQHWEKFSNLLLSTGNKPIVEESFRDQFWGAKPIGFEVLVGMNVLGQLLTTLRDQLRSSNVEALKVVMPPNIPQFFLMGKPVGVIEKKFTHEQYFLVESSALQLAIDFSSPNEFADVIDSHDIERAQNEGDVVLLPPSEIPISQCVNMIQLTFNF